MEMAKSKVPAGWGRESVSATMAEWGWWWQAILVRFVELVNYQYQDSSIISVQRMNAHVNSPIRPNDKHLFIHRKIFPIPTSHICTNCSISLFLQEALDYRPWLDSVSWVEDWQ
jgi:hypothetical protein